MDILKAAFSSTAVFVIFIVTCIFIMFAFTRRRSVFPTMFSADNTKAYMNYNYNPKTPAIFLVSNAVSCDGVLQKSIELNPINSISSQLPTVKPQSLLKKICFILINQINFNYQIEHLPKKKVADHKAATFHSELLSKHNMFHHQNESRPILLMSV